MSRLLLLLLVVLGISPPAAAQDSTALLPIQIPERFTDKADQKISRLDEQLTRKSEKYIRSLGRQEEKIFRALATLDSTAAASGLKDAREKYDQISQKLVGAGNKADRLLNGKYLPGLIRWQPRWVS